MWTPFAAAVGASAAGLSGLTFIVVAFRFDTIVPSAEYRNRVAQALTLFLTVTVTAALITVPQSENALGVELVAAGLFVGAVLIRLNRAARTETSPRARVDLVVALSAFVAAIILGGALLGVGWQGGFYLYAFSAVLGVGWGAYSAWVFLTRAGVPPVAPPSATTP